MSDKINAWIHWVKLNPINKDQLLFAIEVEKLKKENEVLRSNLEAISAGTGETSWTDKLIADSAIEQANKIREGK
ncbi:MAG: hypothetical protein ACK5YR_02285 [Pirellula sp.]|jgi:citrate lyase beta subunit